MNSLPTTGRYIQLPSTGFCALIRQTSTPKPVGALSAQLCGYAAGQNQPAGPAPAGHSLLVLRFLPTRGKSNFHIIQHRITSAKTPRPSLRSVRAPRATTKLRQTAHTADR